MSKEINWLEKQITEYALLEREIDMEMREMNTDPELNQLLEQRKKLNEMIEVGGGIYTKYIDEMREQQTNIKAELISNWDTEEKTFKCDVGTATLRITRSLHIYNKEKLIEFLTTLKKLPDFIKTFEIAKLRKIKDAGLLEDSIANWDESKSIVIKTKEVE